uniref:Uncharacterized protein n=1 Tax=Caenorhabditis japonica TaxID=281687 RepID=A0A8R1ICW4_CAEJA
MKMQENSYWREVDRLDVKPNVAALKQQMASESAPTQAPAPPVLAPILIPEAPTPEQPPKQVTPTQTKKKLGIDSIASKIWDKREMQQQLPAESSAEQQQTETEQKPAIVELPEQPKAPLLEPHQVDRARSVEVFYWNKTCIFRQLANVFDDDSSDDTTPAPETKPPVMSALQKALTSGEPAAYGPPPILKREVMDDVEAAEKDKLGAKVRFLCAASAAAIIVLLKLSFTRLFPLPSFIFL